MMISNNRQKIRRITDVDSTNPIKSNNQAPSDDQIMIQAYAKIGLNDLSWDLLRMIIDYTPRKEVYPVLRGINR